MKKFLSLMLALLMAALLLTPALAEAAETVEAVVEEAADAAETAAEEVTEAAEETVEEVADAAETAAEEVTEAAEEAAETAEEAAEEVSEEAEEAAEEAPAVSPVFKKLLEVPWYSWVVLAVLVVAAVLLALAGRNAKWDSRRLSIGAMCIAIAFVLSCIRLFRMPQGGSITPAAMLPLVMFMVACGPLQGFVVGCAFGLLQLITDPYVIHPLQLLVDYPLAYGAMILGCIAVALPIDKKWKLPIAALLAGIGRYIMAVLSGTVFFGEYAPEGQTALAYSLIYNISYIGPDVLVCMIVACIPGMDRLVDMIKKDDSGTKKG